MATTKKKIPAKKLSTAKNTKSTARPWSWRFSILTVGIYAIAVATIIIAAFFVANKVNEHQMGARYDRIQAIYSSLKLDDSYRVETANVFGQKRVYSWDKSRTYSSEIKYVHGDTVSNTVAELDGKIKAAGFTFMNEPYAGSVFTQYHYKSADGEYIRLSVSSKPYDDATASAYVMDKDTTEIINTLDKNAGPANVVIKVNLDDNNE
jgi:hypothetical protein